MRLISRYYSGPDSLSALAVEVNTCGVTPLVQVFARCHDPDLVQHLITDIQDRMPGANVVGMSCYGTILDDEVSRHQALITVLLPDQTEFRCAISEISTPTRTDHKALGEALAHQVIAPDTRCLLVFTNFDCIQSDALLGGVQQACPGIPVAGGRASTDPDKPGTTLVWCNDTISACGVVMVSLSGPALDAWHDQNLGAAPMGMGLQVTRLQGNWIMELDHTPVLDIYRRYLGSDVTDNLPRSILGFPLIVERQGTMIALDALERSTEGALRYTIPLQKGETVYFAFPHVERMLNGAAELAERLRRHGTADALLVYTCASHMWTLEGGTGIETGLLSGVAPVAGCFTSGEFCTIDNMNQHLNQSMTVLMLREQTERKLYPEPPPVSLSALRKAHDSVHLRTVKALHGLVSRITDELAIVNHNLQKERTFYRALIEEMLDGLSLIDARGYCQYQSPSNMPIHGWPAEELTGEPFIEFLVHPEDRAMLHVVWQQLLDQPNGRARVVTRLKHRDGHWIVAEAQFRNCLAMPEVHAVITYFRDVTELKRLEANLRRLATTDELTALANRRFFLENARKEQRRASRSGTDLSILILDLDHFKHVNDSYGHAAGDRVLANLAALMQQQMRDQDVVGRLGGEEFAVLLPDTELEGATVLAERLRAALEEQRVNGVANQPLQVTASIGVACLKGGKGSIDYLIGRADEALYHAKRSGRNRIHAAPH